MKALELLQYLKDGMDIGYPPKHIINNAIEEIENLQNRSCATCKYGNDCQFDDEVQCFKIGDNTRGLYFEKDFYCKSWKTGEL